MFASIHQFFKRPKKYRTGNWPIWTCRAVVQNASFFSIWIGTNQSIFVLFYIYVNPSHHYFNHGNNGGGRVVLTLPTLNVERLKVFQCIYIYVSKCENCIFGHEKNLSIYVLLSKMSCKIAFI